MVKVVKLAAILVCIALFARLGFRSAAAAVTASAVIALGPARLRSLPRRDRTDAAIHLLAALASASLTVVFSGLSLIAFSAGKSMLASLAAWMGLGSMFLIIAFHLTSYPLRSGVRRQRAVEAASVYSEKLPKAS